MPLRDFIAATELVDGRPLTDFCRAVEQAVTRHGAGEAAAADVARALPALLHDPHWLTGPWQQAGDEAYQQHPLYIDPAGRFSVVSFVWGPGQFTPIHDHGVWGVIGVLRGAERAQRFRRRGDGRLEPLGSTRLMQAGDIDLLKPSEGDIHRVANALADRVSISIHAYAADIGAVSRRTFAEDGTPQRFVSGYSGVPPALTRT
jgi:predicted metal-dependent enzyme (double-stranded beta helix superfamily)